MSEVIELHPDRSVVHLAGAELTVSGRFLRQRCAWCGEVLVDVDLANCSTVQPGDGSEGHRPRGWKAGTWIRVEGEWPTVLSIVEPDEGKFPERSCMAIEIDAIESATP